MRAAVVAPVVLLMLLLRAAPPVRAQQRPAPRADDEKLVAVLERLETARAVLGVAEGGSGLGNVAAARAAVTEVAQLRAASELAAGTDAGGVYLSASRAAAAAAAAVAVEWTAVGAPAERPWPACAAPACGEARSQHAAAASAARVRLVAVQPPDPTDGILEVAAALALAAAGPAGEECADCAAASAWHAVRSLAETEVAASTAASLTAVLVWLARAARDGDDASARILASETAAVSEAALAAASAAGIGIVAAAPASRPSLLLACAAAQLRAGHGAVGLAACESAADAAAALRLAVGTHAAGLSPAALRLPGGPAPAAPAAPALPPPVPGEWIANAAPGGEPLLLGDAAGAPLNASSPAAGFRMYGDSRTRAAAAAAAAATGAVRRPRPSAGRAAASVLAASTPPPGPRAAHVSATPVTIAIPCRRVGLRDVGGGVCELCPAASGPNGTYCRGDGVARICSNAPTGGVAAYVGPAGGSDPDCPFVCVLPGQYRDREWCVPAPVGWYAVNGSAALLPCAPPALGGLAGLVLVSGGGVTGDASSCNATALLAAQQLVSNGSAVPSALCDDVDAGGATVAVSLRLDAASATPGGGGGGVALVGQSGEWRLVLAFAGGNASSADGGGGGGVQTEATLLVGTPALRSDAGMPAPPRSRAFRVAAGEELRVAAVIAGERVEFYADGASVGGGWLPRAALRCGARAGTSAPAAGAWFVGGERRAFEASPYEPSRLVALEGVLLGASYAGVASSAAGESGSAAELLALLGGGGLPPRGTAPELAGPELACMPGEYGANSTHGPCVACPPGAGGSLWPRADPSDCTCPAALDAAPSGLDPPRCPAGGGAAGDALAAPALPPVPPRASYARPFALVVGGVEGADALRVEVRLADGVTERHIVRGAAAGDPGAGLPLLLRSSATVVALATGAGRVPSGPSSVAVGVFTQIAPPSIWPPNGTRLGSGATVFVAPGVQPPGVELSADEASLISVRYTTDGSDPERSATAVVVPDGAAGGGRFAVRVGPGVTLRAVATAQDAEAFLTSAEARATYPLAVAPVVPLPPAAGGLSGGDGGAGAGGGDAFCATMWQPACAGVAAALLVAAAAATVALAAGGCGRGRRRRPRTGDKRRGGAQATRRRRHHGREAGGACAATLDGPEMDEEGHARGPD